MLKLDFFRTAAVLSLLLTAAPARAGSLPRVPDSKLLLKMWAGETGLGAIPVPDPGPEVGPAIPIRPAPGRSANLRGFISSWMQDCSAGCGLPGGVTMNDPVDLVLPLPDLPGEFRMAKFSRSYRFKTLDPAGEARALEVVTTIYAVCPRPAPASESSPALSEGDPCPARYFQAQIELSGAAAAQCGVSLNPADVEPFPVMACGAFWSGKPFRIGVSLHRIRLGA